MIMGLQGLQALNLLKALLVIAHVNSLRLFIYLFVFFWGGGLPLRLKSLREVGKSALHQESVLYIIFCFFFFKCLLSA